MKQAPPCHYCGAPTRVRHAQHRASCPVFKRWAHGGLRAGKNSTLTGRERVSVEGLADSLRDW